jgi:hypothetical protein
MGAHKGERAFWNYSVSPEGMRLTPLDRESLQTNRSTVEKVAQTVGARKLHQETAYLALKKFCKNLTLTEDEVSCGQQAYVLRTMRNHLEKKCRETRKLKSCQWMVQSSSCLPKLPKRKTTCKKSAKRTIACKKSAMKVSSKKQPTTTKTKDLGKASLICVTRRLRVHLCRIRSHMEVCCCRPFVQPS